MPSSLFRFRKHSSPPARSGGRARQATAAEAAAAKQTAVVQQLEQAYKTKAAEVDEASVTLKAANALAAQFAAGQSAR